MILVNSCHHRLRSRCLTPKQSTTEEHDGLFHAVWLTTLHGIQSVEQISSHLVFAKSCVKLTSVDSVFAKRLGIGTESFDQSATTRFLQRCLSLSWPHSVIPSLTANRIKLLGLLQTCSLGAHSILPQGRLTLFTGRVPTYRRPPAS